MHVDMSPTAVTLRLRRASQLRRLCIELGKMKPVISAEHDTTEGDGTAPGSLDVSRKLRGASNEETFEGSNDEDL